MKKLLTRGQMQILRLAAAGYSQREIGGQLGLAICSIEATFARIRIRLEARNGIEMIARAIHLGAIGLEDVIALQQARRAGLAAQTRRRAA
jgi:DNA-binding NarL/FixJ family response regulator